MMLMMMIYVFFGIMNNVYVVICVLDYMILLVFVVWSFVFLRSELYDFFGFEEWLVVFVWNNSNICIVSVVKRF